MTIPPPDREYARRPLADIEPGENVRTDITPQSVRPLAENIKLHGLQVPLIGYDNPLRPGKVILLDGHRRRVALLLAGVTHADLVILSRKPDEAELTEIQLSLGNTNERLSPFNTADGIMKLMRLRGISQDEAARRTGYSPSKVSKILTISAHLAPALRPAVEAGELPFRAAAALARLKDDHAAQAELAEQFRQGRLNCETLEAEVTRRLRGAPKPPPPKALQGKADGRRFEIGLAAGDTVDAVIDWLKAVAARLAKHREVPPEQLGFLFGK